MTSLDKKRKNHIEKAIDETPDSNISPVIYEIRREMIAETTKRPCYDCEEEYPEDDLHLACEDVWDDDETIEICGDCYDNYYVRCNWCEMLKPVSHGQTSLYREVDGEYICLKCFEKHIVENGTPADWFTNNQLLPGMFFDRSELQDHNYGLLDSIFVRGGKQAREIKDNCLEMIEQGHKIAIRYVRLACIGTEGRIEVWMR